MPTEFEHFSEQQSYEKIIRLLQFSAHGIHDILLSLPESLQKQVMAAAIAVTHFMQEMVAASQLHAALQTLREQTAQHLKELQKKITDLDLIAANDPARQRELHKLNALYQKTNYNLTQLDESLAQLNIKLGALNQEIAQVQFNIQQTVQSFMQSVTHIKQQTQLHINANVDQTLQANPKALPIILQALPQQSEQQAKQIINEVATAVAYQRAQAPSPEKIEKMVRPQLETDNFTEQHKRRSIMLDEIVAYNVVSKQKLPINAPENKQAKTELVRISAMAGSESMIAVKEEQQQISSAINKLHLNLNLQHAQLKHYSAQLDEVNHQLMHLKLESLHKHQDIRRKVKLPENPAITAEIEKINGKMSRQTAKLTQAKQNLREAETLMQTNEQVLQTMHNFFKNGQQSNSTSINSTKPASPEAHPGIHQGKLHS